MRGPGRHRSLHRRPGALRLALLVTATASPALLSPAQAQDQDSERLEQRRDGLDDIVVTARRRAEPSQRVPASVVALTAGQLEARSVTNLRSLQRFVPNLTFAPSQNVGEAAGNIFIRGIGQEDFGVGAEPGVGFYVDGVYFGRAFGTIMDLVDVERIEVLRGPQGTLYGKNTIGGAINLVSAMPAAQPEHRASVILGNPGRAELRAVANQPLSPNLLARLSAALVRHDGHLDRLAPAAPASKLEAVNWRPVDLRNEGAERNLAGRFQLRWLPADALTVDLALDGSRVRGSQSATHLDAIDARFGIFPRLNDLIARGLLPGPLIDSSLVPDSMRESFATGRNFKRQEMWGGSARAAYEFGSNRLMLLGAYRQLRSHIGTDTDGLHFDIGETDLSIAQDQWSGELQLTGARGALTYTAGLFAFREESDILPTNASINNVLYTCGCYYDPANPPVFVSDPRSLSSSSYAAYAQGILRLADPLSVTLGVRASRETKRISGTAFRLDSDLRPTDEVVGSGASRGSWSPLTYRAGIDYRIGPDVMAYASLARGYKSGGFNARISLSLPNLGFYGFRPETALTYEAGLRSEWLGRRLRFNATAFHTAYRDIQLRQQVLIGGVVTNLIENAARARIRGIEIEAAAMPLRGLTLSAAYGHIDARYRDVGTVAGLTLDTRFQRTPRHSWTASVDWERPLGDGTIALHGDYSYRSKEQFQILPAINDQDGFGLLDARLTYRSAGGGWALALFGTNLADVRYRSAGRGTLLTQAGVAYSTVGPPRQVGLQVTRRF